MSRKQHGFVLMLLLIGIQVNLTAAAHAVPAASAALTAQSGATFDQPTLPPLPDYFPKIDAHPRPAVPSTVRLDALPVSAADQPPMIDLRSADLTGVDLTDSLEGLLNASFDSLTRFPPSDRLPSEFDPQQVLEAGKNPGLSIRKLHDEGITGAGIGIAIIDFPLLVDHQEYVDQLRLYEETGTTTGTAEMHGTGVASLAAGREIGTAPDADLYFLSPMNCFDFEAGIVDFTCLAGSVRRVLEINEILPEGRKIRVLAMAIGWGPNSPGYAEITAAAAEARAAGLLVICSSTEEIHGFKFNGLGRDPLADPEQPGSYQPGAFWSRQFFLGLPELRATDFLLVPMDSRTVAAPEGTDIYTFYRYAGWSWSIPYIAGVYALAAQVKPAITPDEFWALALETGTTTELTSGNQKLAFGQILNAPALIEMLRTS